jgi:hypothetical protein
VDVARRRVLRIAGAYIRNAARWSIRKRQGTSPPGSPPHSHTGLLKDLLFYSFDPATDTVVIGPAKLNQVNLDGDGQPVSGTVPQVLEYGGKIGVREVYRRGGWQRADLRSRRRLADLPSRRRIASVAKRPYMGPALAKAQPRLPALWANSVRGT